MKIIKLGMIGFGNVAHGFIQALIEKKTFFRKELGFEFLITSITDIRYGTIYNPDGLPLKKLVSCHDFSEMDQSLFRDWNTIQMIRNAESDVIIELSFTDLKTGEPAVLHCQEALLSGKHVITSNKGPIALHYSMLKGLARDNGVKIGCEGTVMSGTPALRLATDSLLLTGITEIKGILNGTTNFILTEMENGSTYEAALEEAQRLGYAEADPSGDVEGFDTAGKVAILAHLVFGTFIKPEDIDRLFGTESADTAVSGAGEHHGEIFGAASGHPVFAGIPVFDQTEVAVVCPEAARNSCRIDTVIQHT